MSYYVYDGHGSVRALADESGKVTDKYAYDAFGNLISSVGSTKNDFLFAGEQFDPVTGLYYLRARYMNPSVGTFISMDSYEGSIDDPVSLHKYLYANANPVMYSNPSEYAATVAEMAVAGAVIGALSGLIVPNVFKSSQQIILLTIPPFQPVPQTAFHICRPAADMSHFSGQQKRLPHAYKMYAYRSLSHKVKKEVLQI